MASRPLSHPVGREDSTFSRDSATIDVEGTGDEKRFVKPSAPSVHLKRVYRALDRKIRFQFFEILTNNSLDVVPIFVDSCIHTNKLGNVKTKFDKELGHLV